MIVNKYNQGGGGSGSGMTPQQVQQQIDTSLTPYWDSGETKDYVDEAVSGISLEGYYTSAQTEEAIISKGYASQDQVDEIDEVVAESLNDLQAKIDELSGATPSIDLSGYYTSAQTEERISSAYTILDEHITEVEQVTASAYTELHDDIIELSARTGGNSNILASITTDEEYGAISGSVKTGDLIQVWDVDINGDEEGEYGLFQAEVSETEDPQTGVIARTIEWYRRDSSDSVTWTEKNYPWMTDNETYPIEIDENSFLISPDSAGDGSYNGIGFDNDGKAVITHIVPEEDEQTGEITGMTREDRDILGELDTLDEVVAESLNDLNERVTVLEVSGGTPSVDLSGYYTSAQTEEAISTATSGKADAVSVSGNTNKAFFPAWNEQGIITGRAADNNTYKVTMNGNEHKYYGPDGFNWSFYAPKTSGSAGEFLVADGTSIPKWSAVTIPDMSNYYTSAETFTSAQTQSAITAATQNMVTSTSIDTIWKGTQAEYDTATQSGATADPNTFYIILPSA